MRIEKFVHACLRITVEGETLLFDPGKFSFTDGRVDPRQLAGPSLVALTHDYPDHIDFDALRIIVGEGPTTIRANGEAARALHEKGFSPTIFEQGERAFGAFRLAAIPTPHAPILGTKPAMVMHRDRAHVAHQRLKLGVWLDLTGIQRDAESGLC